MSETQEKIKPTKGVVYLTGIIGGINAINEGKSKYGLKYDE